ncbi:MAG: hypothetical protein ACK55Z_03380, partial [bacterium]
FLHLLLNQIRNGFQLLAPRLAQEHVERRLLLLGDILLLPHIRLIVVYPRCCSVLRLRVIAVVLEVDLLLFLHLHLHLLPVRPHPLVAHPPQLQVLVLRDPHHLVLSNIFHHVPHLAFVVGCLLHLLIDAALNLLLAVLL